MFCKRCGKYNTNSEPVCRYCGGELTEHQTKNIEESSYEDKTVVGVLMALFLGVLGLLIGLLLYPAHTWERESFLSGWLKCFVVTIIIGLVLLFSFTCAAAFGGGR